MFIQTFIIFFLYFSKNTLFFLPFFTYLLIFWCRLFSKFDESEYISASNIGGYSMLLLPFVASSCIKDNELGLLLLLPLVLLFSLKLLLFIFWAFELFNVRFWGSRFCCVREMGGARDDGDVSISIAWLIIPVGGDLLAVSFVFFNVEI